MIRILPVLCIFLIFISGCTETEIEVAEKPGRTLTIEVADTDVVKLNGKEIHVSFLEDQLAKMAESYELTAEIRAEPDAPFGVVSDAQLAVRLHSPQIVYQDGKDESVLR